MAIEQEPTADDEVSLGPTQYGKSEIRLLRVERDTPRHVVRDITVSTMLRGDFTDSYVSGDQTGQLPTDSQKNAVFSYARQYGIGAIEDFALRLARHFADDIDLVTEARVAVSETAWERIDIVGEGHDHSFVRAGQGARTASAVVGGADGGETNTTVTAGVKDLAILKSTGSGYRGYLKDPYTTLAETSDRVLATSLTATWRYGAGGPAGAGADRAGTPAGEAHAEAHPDWDGYYRRARDTLLAQFAAVESKALQHSLWNMGRSVLAGEPQIEAIHLSAPNLHHFLVDLEPFGLDNPGEVFRIADRPYGLIEATVVRGGASPRVDWPDGGTR
jgi:urate oxidase